MSLSSSALASPSPPVGYLALVRGNRDFRRVWLGEVVSLTGDWFTSIALFSMLLEFTGRGEAVGYALVARFLPSVLFGPAAGVLADRVSRRAILVTCDLLRAVVVLGFLLVRDGRDVWLIYLLVFLQTSASAFFEPAEQAAVGAVVRREEIVAANTLQGITWSAMMAFGALAGGMVTAALGVKLAFLVDSATYLVSAVLVAGARIPRAAPSARPAGLVSVLGLTDLREGLAFVRGRRDVARLILAKSGW
ncbi:MAG: MFS transporter, partial [Myxococcales bacterium]